MPRRAPGVRAISEFASKLRTEYGPQQAANLLGVSRSSLSRVIRGGIRSKSAISNWQERAFGASEKLIMSYITADNGIDVRMVPSAETMVLLYPSAAPYATTYKSVQDAANNAASTSCWEYVVIVVLPNGDFQLWDDRMPRNTGRNR